MALNARGPDSRFRFCRYDFSGATTGIYAFWQYELCDVFIELVKPVMSSKGACAFTPMLSARHS